MTKGPRGFRSGALLPLLAAMGGCVTATYVPTGDLYPARPVDCSIEIFTAGLPERPYREIGLVEAEGSFWKADLEDMLPRLREEACLAGGDALILLSTDKNAWSDEDGHDKEELYAVATVIRWGQG